MVELNTIKDLILGFLATGVAAWFVSEFHAMRKSVENLNVSVAQLLEKWRSIEHRVERLEDRAQV